MTIMRAIVIGTAAIALMCSSSYAYDEMWELDLATAIEKAQEQDKPVLADFSGSDWCGWCKKLDEEVFSTETFKEFAEENLVLAIVDFPRDKTILPEGQPEKNETYREQYPVQGYPTVFLLEPDGSVFLKTGYRKGGAEAYVEFLQKVLKARDRVKQVLAGDAPSHEEAVEIMEKIPEEAEVLRSLLVIASFPDDMVEERAKAAYTLIRNNRDKGGRLFKFLESVADTEAGGGMFRTLVKERMQKKLMAGVQKMMEAYEASQADDAGEDAEAKAQAAAKKMLAVTKNAESKVDDQALLQAALVFRSVAFRILDDQAAVDEAFGKAEAIDPKARIITWGRTVAKPSESPEG